MKQTDLPTLIWDFFEKYLVAQRGLGEHTVPAYRDTWKLFLQFASRQCRKSCAALELRDLNAEVVRRFLDYLEHERHNAGPTRNHRLAAIRFKRHARRVMGYLERQEVQRIFDQINAQTALGRRDDALLRLLYSWFHE